VPVSIYVWQTFKDTSVHNDKELEETMALLLYTVNSTDDGDHCNCDIRNSIHRLTQI